jgi:5-methylthioadenosine/S-adenosylhomocysteine deaminase
LTKILADLLLVGADLLLDADLAVIPRGAVAISKDRIVDIGPRSEVEARVQARGVIDCTGQVIMPGLIDCHVHTCQQTARGLADDVPVAEWLSRIVGFEAAMDEEDVVASVRLACLEMIRSGTTGFIEACANPIYVDAVAEVFVESGLRAALTRSSMQHADPTWAAPDRFVMTPDENVAATAAMIRRWNGVENGRISAWSGWRHQQETSDDLLRALVGLMDEYGVGLHAHLATRRTGEIDRLERLGALRPRMVFAHSIRFTRREVELIKLRDVKLDHNPGASMHGAYGASVLGQFPELVAMGVCVSLGCDAAANNNTLDMFREMRLVASVHKEMRGDPTVIPAATAFRMATANGARACAWEGVGALRIGGKADLVAVRLRGRSHIEPIHSVLSSVVFAASGADVQLTMVDGRVLMRDRKVLVFDERAVMNDGIASAERVVQRWRGRTRPAA